MEVARQLSGAAWVADMRPCLASEAETIESGGCGLDDSLGGRLSGCADRAARAPSQWSLHGAGPDDQDCRRSRCGRARPGARRRDNDSTHVSV